MHFYYIAHVHIRGQITVHFTNAPKPRLVVCFFSFFFFRSLHTVLSSIRPRTQTEASHGYGTSQPLEACEDASTIHWHDHLADAGTPHLMLQLLVFEFT